MSLDLSSISEKAAMQSLQTKRNLAKSKFLSGDYDAALDIYETIIETDADPGAYFGAGHIYEYGLSLKRVNLEKALDYYSKVLPFDKDASDSSGAASLAAARVLFKLGDRSKAEKAMGFCRQSIALRDTAESRVMLGIICEEWANESQEARENFILAYKMKAPKAMRLYARSLVKSRKYLAGYSAHLLATSLAPYFFIKRVRRSLLSSMKVTSPVK